MQTSRIARLAGTLGFASLALFVAGPVGIQLVGLDPFLGFRIFLFGALLGLLALVLGLIGLVVTRAAAYRGGRRRALAGALMGAVVVGVTLFAASGGGGVPAINDITTNPDDPPGFMDDPSGEGRDMGYPEGFAAQQRAGYPDLAPISVAMRPGDALDRVVSLFDAYGWVVTRNDPVGNTLEGTDTSRLFRFVDDIAVRVRPEGAGSVVDVRSKSRVGRGDMGANAERIRKLRAGLSQGG